MGTILASSIISDVRLETLDEDSGNYRISDAEYLKLLNNGQRFIVMHVPKANVVNSAWQLAAGILQTIPTGCIELISIDFNMGTNGTTQGAPIRIIEKDDLDRLKPGARHHAPHRGAADAAGRHLAWHGPACRGLRAHGFHPESRPPAAGRAGTGSEAGASSPGLRRVSP